jgi:hypothetical protein
MKLKKDDRVDVLVNADYPPGFEMEFEGFVRHAKKGEQIIIGATGPITRDLGKQPSECLEQKPMKVYTESIRDETADVTCFDDLPNRKSMYLYSEIRAAVEHPNGISFTLEFRVAFKDGERKKVKQMEREIRGILNYTGPIQTK